jgi:nucleoside-diphosphate-sugar epimerase
MKILITGSEGRIGRHLAQQLYHQGYDLRGFDVVAIADRQRDHIPGDLCDLSAVRRAMQGVDAVVHLGAIPYDRDDGHAVMQTNVIGSWNVLQAAQECGVQRVVAFSSINAQGSVKGLRPTDYLPIDDHYPHHPLTPYQLAKHLGEEICRSFSERHGMITLCLRPTWVAHPDHYSPFYFGAVTLNDMWKHEYWAYVDVRDVCDAVLCCLRLEHVRHDAFLLSADDTAVDVTSAELVQRYYPDTAWRKIERDAYFAGQPYRSLIDCSHAKEVLGWQPRHSWRQNIKLSSE